MKIKFLLTVLPVMTLAALPAFALTAPHSSHNSIGCDSCHTFKNAPGPNSTKSATNYGLCTQAECHSILNPSTMHFPFDDSSFKNMTVGVRGAFHRWEANAENPAVGAGTPTDINLSLRIRNGKIQCSTCHDQHAGSSVQSIGPVRKGPVVKVNPLGGSGLASYTTAAKPTAYGYTIEIVAGGEVGAATYKISFNNGYSWRGWNGSSWVTYNNNPRTTSTSYQAIDSSSNALIKFTSGAGSDFVAGERWKFHIAYPYPRLAYDVGSNTGGRKFCRDCHSQRAQTHYNGGNKWDGSIKSHPVGVALNSNGGGYDRKPLDVDGVRQGLSTDANRSNNLLLFQGTTSMPIFGNISSGDVQCLSCHAPHWADSNSKTKDRGR